MACRRPGGPALPGRRRRSQPLSSSRGRTSRSSGCASTSARAARREPATSPASRRIVTSAMPMSPGWPASARRPAPGAAAPLACDRKGSAQRGERWQLPGRRQGCLVQLPAPGGRWPTPGRLRAGRRQQQCPAATRPHPPRRNRRRGRLRRRPGIPAAARHATAVSPPRPRRRRGPGGSRCRRWACQG